MVCPRKRRQQIFEGLSQKQRNAIVQIYKGGNRAYPEIHPRLRLSLVAFRYIRQNTRTGLITILPEGKRAAMVVIVES